MSNYIDTRDLYQRKCELESLRDALKDAKETLEAAQTALEAHNDTVCPADDTPAEKWLDQQTELEEAVSDAEGEVTSAEQDFSTDEEAELAELEELESEISEFRDGETMIPEHMFTEYAEQLAEDCGDYNSRDVKWPFTCIDWSQAAKELAMDYSIVTYQGTDYYVRS